MPGRLTELMEIETDAEEIPRHRIAADEDEDADLDYTVADRTRFDR